MFNVIWHVRTLSYAGPPVTCVAAAALSRSSAPSPALPFRGAREIRSAPGDVRRLVKQRALPTLTHYITLSVKST